MPGQGDMEATSGPSLQRVQFLCLQDGPSLPLDQQLRRPPQHEILPAVRVLHYAFVRNVVPFVCAFILQFIDASQHSLPYESQGKFITVTRINFYLSLMPPMFIC